MFTRGVSDSIKEEEMRGGATNTNCCIKILDNCYSTVFDSLLLPLRQFCRRRPQLPFVVKLYLHPYLLQIPVLLFSKSFYARRPVVCQELNHLPYQLPRLPFTFQLNNSI